MKSRLSNRSLATRLLAVTALAGLLAAVYILAIRPSQLRWGATPEEVTRATPGDELVPSPTFCATRAITIRGTPRDIWPWLIQMGYRRAGFYGYDLIENIGSERGIRSADSILPEFQHPTTGDVLPISAVASMAFDSIQANSYLVWRGTAIIPSDGSLVWALYPTDANHTRLVSRVRLHYHWTDWRLLALDLFTEFGDHVAVPRILLGIKDRVEGQTPQPIAEEAIEIAVWLLSLAEFAAAIVFVFRCNRWGYAWLLGLAAGLLLLFALYAHEQVWMSAAISTFIFAGMLLLSLLSPSKANDHEF